MIEVYNKADLLPGVPLLAPAPGASPGPDASPASDPSTPSDSRQRSGAAASPSVHFTSAHNQRNPAAGAAAADRVGSGDTLAGERMDGLHAESAGEALADREPGEGTPWLQAHGAAMHEEAGASCAPSAACAPGVLLAAGATACGDYAAEQAALDAHEAGPGERPSLAEGARQDGSRGDAAGAHAPPEGPGHGGARAGLDAAALPRLYTSTVTRSGLYELLREIDRKARARCSAVLHRASSIIALMQELSCSLHSPLHRKCHPA